MADPPGPPTTPRRNRARTNSLPPSPAPMQQPPLTHMDDLSDDDIDTIRGTPADDDGDVSYSQEYPAVRFNSS